MRFPYPRSAGEPHLHRDLQGNRRRRSHARAGVARPDPKPWFDAIKPTCCLRQPKRNSGDGGEGLKPAAHRRTGDRQRRKGKIMADIRQPGSSSPPEAAPSPRRLPAHGEIGFVGLGRMGTAMAANLVAAGHRVTAYVRRPDQMDKLATLGLDPTPEFADLDDCEVVITMVPDD